MCPLDSYWPPTTLRPRRQCFVLSRRYSGSSKLVDGTDKPPLPTDGTSPRGESEASTQNLADGNPTASPPTPSLASEDFLPQPEPPEEPAPEPAAARAAANPRRVVAPPRPIEPPPEPAKTRVENKPKPDPPPMRIRNPIDLARRLKFRPRARAVEAEAQAEAELESGPPSIPSAASVAPGRDEQPMQGAPGPAFVGAGHVIADRYEVLGVLGEGGMGIVYRCLDQLSGQHVALKRVIVPEAKLRRDYVMWFYKESRALAALDHPGIVRARDFGQLVDGSPYLVMELVNGVSLHDLSYSRLPFPVVWSIVDQMLGALAHAHARGVIHGDLKPSNVLVEEVEGAPPRIRILDFGLAWLKQDPHDERLDGAKALEFAPHAGAGTPGYMAPEQIQHEMHHVSGATDLYSLGCILFRMLSGQAPFTGESRQLLKRHAFEKPPRLEPAIAVPEGVAEFAEQLLAKRPWDRWEFAAHARAEWAAMRPNADVPAGTWRLPHIRRHSRSSQVKAAVDASDAQPNQRLAAVLDRAPGLLNMRPSPLVGREEIRTLLRKHCDELAAAVAPLHRLVLLTGPAGAGKSRIAEWLCEVVHEEGLMVPLRARYRPVSTPLDGLLGAVTQYFNFERADRDTIERSLLARWKIPRNDKQGRTWVAGVAEWLRPLGPMSDQPMGPSGVRFTLDTVDARRMVTRYALRRIARRRPLLFWLDDLHHANDHTLEGLLKYASEEPEQPLLIVATARSEELQIGTKASENIRALQEALNGETVEVQPMHAEETRELLRASLPLQDAAVEEAARRSRGNPLFALQQLHAWALAGEMELVDGVYCVADEVLSVKPQTTAELWDSRVAALPPEHRLGAYATASLGGDIRHEVLSALLESLELPPEAVIGSLQSAEVILPRGPGRYAWPHQLLQEHLAEKLSTSDSVRRVYRAAAEALTKHPMARSRRVVRQRVLCLLQAGDPDAASTLLFDFLTLSWHGARDPAESLADLELLKGKLQGRSLALKHRWQAEALRHVGRPDDAMMHAEIARSSLDEANDRENVAHCERLLGHLKSQRGASTEGLALVQRAHATFEALGNLSGQAQCEVVAGEIHYLLGRYDIARAQVERGERNFAKLGQPMGRGQCLLLRGRIEHSEGATERAQRYTMEARSEFERAGYRLGVAEANVTLAHIEHRLCNYYNAERGALEALSMFTSLSTPRGQAASERLLGMVGLDIDDLDMSELHTDRARAVYEELGDPWGLLETRLLSAQAALAKHDLEHARTLLARCKAEDIAEPEPRQHLLLTLAWVAALQDDPGRGLELIDAAARVFDQHMRVGAHTPHLLARLSRLRWPPYVHSRIDAWRLVLMDRPRSSVA